MKRYLLFDSGCCKCSKIAESIEQEVGGKLAIRSLRDPAVKELLDRERPGWKWEPMLVEEKEGKVRIYAGGAMSRRLLLVLGPRRAAHVMKVISDISIDAKSENIERRKFLRLAGVAALGSVALMLTKGVSSAEGGPPLPPPQKHQLLLSYKVPPPNEQALFRRKAEDSGRLKKFLEQNVPSQKFKVSEHEPRMFIIDDRIVVQYFLEGGAGYSGYEIHFDQSNGRIIETRAALFDRIGSDTISSKFFVNDILHFDVIVSNDGHVLQGWATDINGKDIPIDQLQRMSAQSIQLSWSCLNSCLASLGVPSWILGVFGLICAAVCVGTAGWGCYACIAGVGYGFYLEAWYCIGQCWYA